jgi:hypothetical protein
LLIVLKVAGTTSTTLANGSGSASCGWRGLARALAADNAVAVADCLRVAPALGAGQGPG